MSLSAHKQMRYWSIAAAILLLVLWYVGDIVMPFILGGAIAYFLDPVADRMEQAGLSRVLATVIITFFALILFVFIALLIIPTLIEQTIALINAAPDMFNNLKRFLTERFPSLIDANSTLRQSLDSLGQTIQAKGGQLANGLLSSAISLINVVLLMVIVPVVAFYMLLDWDKMVRQINDLLPLDHADNIRQIAADVDRTLSSFIRGQGSVCLVMGAFYAIGLMLVGLQFGLLVGAFAGLITFIPYVGALIGGALALGLGVFQFWGDWMSLGLVAVVFAAGQALEGNVITPKLVGDSVGLHPVWLMLALTVFGALFGFVGMLVAVPVAAIIGVLTRFGIAQYRQGALYKGSAGGQTGPETTDR
ncbi:MAG: AI-2E family transporter [Rhodobacterales bacterium]|nr:MAG: AI-2E family transporter [Rhodobacterales bacterium]